MATATKTKPITFIARAIDLRLIADPEDVERNHRGQIIRRFPGSAVEFQQHRYETDPEDTIAFQEKDVPVVEFLRQHPTFNVDFWEVGNAPGEAKPTEQEQHAAIIRALAEGNSEAIYSIAQGERETHKRVRILDAAETALEALAGDSPESPDVKPE